MIDEIYSYREICDLENVQTLQRGMNFRMNPNYSVLLMSRRSNAPYKDRILDDNITIEYEGHDEVKYSQDIDPKLVDQPKFTPKGTLTQNGKFINAANDYKQGLCEAELVKIYEKILPGVWSLKGYFELIDFNIKYDGRRKTFIFILRLAENQSLDNGYVVDLKHTRLIPSEVKKKVWKRDHGQCVICSSKTNLHFDHDLPFSKGGSSLTSKNIRLLCAKCNLSKSNKIE